MADQPIFLLSDPVDSLDHARGFDRARVTLVQYADFECLHCGRAYPELRRIHEDLGDAVRVVFRHFPLGWEHPHAQKAAEAAEAAAAQGRFWAMHDFLFEHQRALDEEALVAYARVLALDVDRFRAELRERAHAERVARDVESARRSGVRGTPTFFLDGVRYGEALDLGALRTTIERAAAAAGGGASEGARRPRSPAAPPPPA